MLVQVDELEAARRGAQTYQVWPGAIFGESYLVQIDVLGASKGNFVAIPVKIHWNRLCRVQHFNRMNGFS